MPSRRVALVKRVIKQVRTDETGDLDVSDPTLA